jgi:hypothetical protein
MAIQPIKIKFDSRAFNKLVKRQASLSNRISQVTINEFLVTQRKKAIDQGVTDLNIPKGVLRKIRKGAGESSNRLRVLRASKRNLRGAIILWARGIPVSALKPRQIRRSGRGKYRATSGVKTSPKKGNRLYKDAFLDRDGNVFKLRNNGKLMVPKIGVRKYFDSQLTARIQSQSARRDFKRLWAIKFNLAKSGAVGFGRGGG